MDREQVKALREKSIQQVVSFGIYFRPSTLYLIRQKYPEIDLSSIDFKSIEGNDVHDQDDCSGEGDFSKSVPIFDSLDSSLYRAKDADVVDVNSS